MAVPATYDLAGVRNVTATSFEPLFISGGDGGSLPIDFQVAVSKSSTMSSPINSTIQYSGLPVSGLYPFTKYYYRVRGRNSSGYGAWSSIGSFTTTKSPPAPPHPYFINAPDPATIRYYFAPDPNDGGSGVVQYQVAYGTDPNGPQNVQDSDENGNVTITNGIQRNTLYYVWVRARNLLGWSDYSSRSQIQTPAYVPASPSPSTIDTITQVSVRYVFVQGDNGGANIEQMQVGWGTDPNNIQYTVNSNGTSIITGLSPATVWYFWSRSKNQAGWSNWSQRSQARTLAGSRIKIDGIWREAIPYVKDGGSWHLARPYVKSVGLWDNTV